MTIEAVRILHRGWSGSQKWQDAHAYKIVYQVQTSSMSDGPETVADASQGGTSIPSLGDTYSVGNDSNSNLRLNTKTLRNVADNMWQVECSFSPLSPKIKHSGAIRDGVDPNGEPVDPDSPASGGWDIEVGTVAHVRPALRGLYLGMWTPPGGVVPPDQIGMPIPNTLPGNRAARDEWIAANDQWAGPIVNSAGIKFVPPPERDFNRVMLRLSKNLDEFDRNWLRFANTVNRQTVQLNRQGVHVIIGQFLGRMMSVQMDQRITQGGLFFFTWTWEILIDEHFGWRPDILDEGLVEIEKKDKLTGADLQYPRYAAVTDHRGRQFQQPVPYDGTGQPNRDSVTQELDSSDPEMFLRYAVYPETDWDTLPPFNPAY